MELAGRTALITGGATRVGRVITLAFAGAGADVVVNYKTSAEQAEATAAEAASLGVAALAVRADVADHPAVVAMVGQAVDRFGRVDVLVNNASSFVSAPMPTDDLTAWHTSIDTLVHGPFYCANAVAPVMLANDGGVIIGIGDLTAFEPWPGFTGHAVGKSAVFALTRQLALELAPTIRANAVVLGPTLRPDDYDQATYDRIADDTLVGRWGTPEEIAAAILFLVGADYVTGEVMTVDGGQRFGHRKHEHG